MPISIIKLILPESISRLIVLPDNYLPYSIQEYELKEFMPNYFLNKVDAMSMLNSIEVKPFISGDIRNYNKDFINKDYSTKKQYLIIIMVFFEGNYREEENGFYEKLKNIQ